MGQPENLDPSAFYLPGGPTGVLLIHGVPGSPPEMRLLGDYLHARGITVSAPLLPGHGTTPQDLNAQRWTDWIEHLERTLIDLHSECHQVFAAGLSGGGVMTLYLAATHLELSGAITYSAALKLYNPLIHLVPIGKYLIRQFPMREEHLTDPEAINRLWTYDTYPTFAVHQLQKLTSEVNQLLPHVHSPFLIVQSTLDRDVRPESAELIYRSIGSADKELLWLHNSGHPVTVDSEWETVADRTYQFIRAHSRGIGGDARDRERDAQPPHSPVVLNDRANRFQTVP